MPDLDVSFYSLNKAIHIHFALCTHTPHQFTAQAPNLCMQHTTGISQSYCFTTPCASLRQGSEVRTVTTSWGSRSEAKRET
ncbi:hypothetical protein FKM82_023081 [Ascaphus truei]